MEKNDIREQLIAKLEELLGEENAAEAFLRAKDLKRRWPRVREEEESFSDQELSEKFNKLMDQLSEKAGDVYINTEDRKNQIIAQAKEVLDKNNFKKGTEQMKQLLEDWKHAGRINKEKDDETPRSIPSARASAPAEAGSPPSSKNGRRSAAPDAETMMIFGSSF